MIRNFTLCIVAVLMACLTVNCSAENNRSWKSDYGIDPNNNCPIFTKPPRTGPDRKDGAGICTNDGAAYNRTYYDLGEEWHYEPKLNLCEQEEEAMTRVTGLLDTRNVLKHGVVPMENGGALVAYRVFGYSDNALHYFATYSQAGELIDAIALGTSRTMEDVLIATPHGDYTPMANFGGNSIIIDKTMTMSINRYNFYKTPDSSSAKEWYDTLRVKVGDDGHFVKLGHVATSKPSVNIAADAAMTLMMTPLSDATAIAKWNDLIASCKNNEQATARLLPQVAMLFVRCPQEFMSWTAKNEQRSVLIGALRKAVAADERMADELRMFIAKSIEACPVAKVKQYWSSLREF